MEPRYPRPFKLSEKYAQLIGQTAGYDVYTYAMEEESEDGDPNCGWLLLKGAEQTQLEGQMRQRPRELRLRRKSAAAPWRIKEVLFGINNPVPSILADDVALSILNKQRVVAAVQLGDALDRLEDA